MEFQASFGQECDVSEAKALARARARAFLKRKQAKEWRPRKRHRNSSLETLVAWENQMLTACDVDFASFNSPRMKRPDRPPRNGRCSTSRGILRPPAHAPLAICKGNSTSRSWAMRIRRTMSGVICRLIINKALHHSIRERVRTRKTQFWLQVHR